MSKNAFALLAALAVLSTFAVSGCGPGATSEREHEHNSEGMLTLPALEAADLGGAPLQVVATTSIIGDVVAQVGGEAIELTALMGPGQDPHSYQPTPQDMASVSQAHVVFVNGWDLEQALIHDLEEIAKAVPIVPVSANIEPLAFGEADLAAHEHETADPHTWFSVHNVEQWVENIQQVLSDLDPANARTYGDNAEVYLAELEELGAYVEGQLASIPTAKRFLVTNHDTFGYLAHEYDLQVLGTVLPAASTLADPSASELTDLIAAMEEHDVCTLFTETTVSDKLAQTVAGELDSCAQVRVLKLYTGALGPAGSGAESYIGMFRYNVDTIVHGLQ
jgi:ABC-type Zn uptake system ZnuABC Zn-binding protein ZnuA